MKIATEVIQCPNWTYSQHFVQVTEELVMGEPFKEWQSRLREEDPDENETMSDNDWAVFWEESVAFVLKETDEVKLPPGWTMDGFEFHPHKDALGLVALYFKGNCTRDSCPERMAHVRA